MGEQLSKMEDWDRISQCIATLNHSRAFAEAETLAAVDELLNAIVACKDKINSLGPDDAVGPILNELVELADKSELISRKRDENVLSAVSQVKQAVTHVLTPSDEEECDLGIIPANDEQVDLIDRALAWHFLHEGYLDTARTFSREANLNCLPESDLMRVRSGLDAVDAMSKSKDVAQGIAWLEEHASATSPGLLFDLHRLRFLQLATSQTEAFSYAQRNFARFTPSRSQEIQSLLLTELIQGATPSTSSPLGTTASTAGDEKRWEVARQGLLTEIKRPYSSLSVLVASGSRALPELRMYQKLVGQDSRITTKTWEEAKEMPVQIESLAHFHSEFCCPVSQEQTDQATNPPMLLTCGHVIAKNSIARIAKHRQRFKCPTCPTEQSVDAPTPIQF